MGAKGLKAQLVYGSGSEPSGGERSCGPKRSEGEAGLGRGMSRPWAPATSPLGRSFSLECQPGGSAYIHQCRIDVVARFSIHRDEEGQAAVQRQDIHAPILIMVPWQETDAAVLRPDARSHDVEGLWGQGQIGRYCLDGCPEQRRQQCSLSLHPPSLSLQSFSQDCSLPW